jgi:hypothetical protein
MNTDELKLDPAGVSKSLTRSGAGIAVEQCDIWTREAVAGGDG